MIEKRYRLQEADYHVYSDILDENGEAYRNDKLVDVLNEKDERIQDLKTRNNRQYELLKKITELMYARDWKTLEQMVEEWEEADRLLRAEFKCCNDGDVE